MRLLTFALLARLLVGCGSGDDPSTGSPDGTNTSCSAADAPIVLTDDTNYSFSNSLSIEMTTLADNTDLLFDWSGVTTDFFGRPIDPANDIDVVLISLWNMTPSELKNNIEHDNLPLNVNVGAITTYPDGSYTAQTLTNFDLLGNPLPEEDLWRFFDTSNPEFAYPQDTHTFMVVASTGTALGKGVRMLSMFNLDPGSQNTELFLTSESTQLDFSANLKQARPVRVPAATAELTFDWGEMTTNALGNEFHFTQITEAVVAHYPSQTLADLEAQFLDLEDLAEGWWAAEIPAGKSVDLATLVDDNGNAFQGIDDQGIWLLALFCTAGCNNPAPWSIAILEPCPPS